MICRLLRQRYFFLIFLFAFLLVLLIFILFSFTKPPNKKEKWNSELKRSAALAKKLEAIRERETRFVVYNRVPKCGSMSMTTLSYHLGAVNDFEVASPYEDGEKPGKSEQEQLDFVHFLYKQRSGYMYIRHQYFIDFNKFGKVQPIYINMIRDPISRFQSFYYFSRFGNERGGGANARMSNERRRETIDECVQKRRQECVKPYWQLVPYFCGQAPGCMTRSQWALDEAKRNIQNHYVFVGVLEELEDSLRLLEILLPGYFSNVKSVYKNPENEKIKFETQTRRKQKISDNTKKILKSETSLKLEYDLYDFVRNNLKQLKMELL